MEIMQVVICNSRAWTEGQVGQTLQEHVWNARNSFNLERHMVRSTEGLFHESRNNVPSFLLQSRRRSQKFVSRWRFLCSGSTEAIADLWKSHWETNWGEANWTHWILCKWREGVEDRESNNQSWCAEWWDDVGGWHEACWRSFKVHEVDWCKRRRFVTCQEEWRANSFDWEFLEAHISGVDFVPQLGDWSWRMSLKIGLTSLKRWSVSQDTWKSHGVHTCKNSRSWVDTWW